MTCGGIRNVYNIFYFKINQGEIDSEVLNINFKNSLNERVCENINKTTI